MPISNEDLKQAVDQLQKSWWTNKTEEEKVWYRKFWASLQPKPPRKPQPRYYLP